MTYQEIIKKFDEACIAHIELTDEEIKEFNENCVGKACYIEAYDIEPDDEFETPFDERLANCVEYPEGHTCDIYKNRENCAKFISDGYYQAIDLGLQELANDYDSWEEGWQAFEDNQFYGDERLYEFKCSGRIIMVF